MPLKINAFVCVGHEKKLPGMFNMFKMSGLRLLLFVWGLSAISLSLSLFIFQSLSSLLSLSVFSPHFLSSHLLSLSFFLPMLKKKSQMLIRKHWVPRMLQKQF